MLKEPQLDTKKLLLTFSNVLCERQVIKLESLKVSTPKSVYGWFCCMQTYY